MIILTKLNGVQFALNAELIETISEMPDTKIDMTTKNFYIVKEGMQEVIDKVIEYKRKLNNITI